MLVSTRENYDATGMLCRGHASAHKGAGKGFWGEVKEFASGIRIGVFGKIKIFGVGLTVDTGSVQPFNPDTYKDGGVNAQQQFDVLGVGIAREGLNGNFREDPSNIYSDGKDFEDVRNLEWSVNNNGGITGGVGGGLFIGWETDTELISGAQ